MVCRETVLEASGIRAGLGHGLILMGLVSVTQPQLLALCHLDGLPCRPGVRPRGSCAQSYPPPSSGSGAACALVVGTHSALQTSVLLGKTVTAGTPRWLTVLLGGF